jgi:hypothetical protein
MVTAPRTVTAGARGSRVSLLRLNDPTVDKPCANGPRKLRRLLSADFNIHDDLSAIAQTDLHALVCKNVSISCGTEGMPEVERLRMLYGMIDKISADLVKFTIEDIWLRH